MKYTNRYIMKRVRAMSKEQCEFLIRHLKYIPYELKICKAHVPYIIGAWDEDEEDYDEFAPYQYDDNEDIIDYVSRMVSEQCLDTNRSEVIDLCWQWYRCTSVRMRTYKLPWDKRTLYSPTDDGYKQWTLQHASDCDYYQYKNRGTAIGMETYTQTIDPIIMSGMLPLALVDDNCLDLYACSPVKNGVPCTGFVGKGITTIEDLWRELGGYIDYVEDSDVFPWTCAVSIWRLPNDISESLFNFCKEVRERAAHEWPEDFKQWITPEPEDDDEEEEDDEEDDDVEDADNDDVESEEETNGQHS